MTSVVLISGEPSGDALGAPLVRAIKAQNPAWTIEGIGGPQMIHAGLNRSFVPFDDLSVMGVFEILPRLPVLINHLNKTIEHIEKLNPLYVLTIDAPDFSFRVHTGLKKRGIYQGKHIHVVAPTVWAWRAGRAAKIARFLDCLVCLFPFEPPYFERHGLPCLVMRHPVLEAVNTLPPPTAPNVRPRVGLFLGSRVGEIRRHGPLFRECAVQLLAAKPDLEIIAPTLNARMEQVEACFDGLPVTIREAGQGATKYTLFQSLDVALAVSGTVGFELAVCGVPHAITYRMNPLSWEIIRRMAKVPYAHLANIILDQPVVPEFIQDNADANMILSTLIPLLNDQTARAKQQNNFHSLRTILDHGMIPSEIVVKAQGLATL